MYVLFENKSFAAECRVYLSSVPFKIMDTKFTGPGIVASSTPRSNGSWYQIGIEGDFEAGIIEYSDYIILSVSNLGWSISGAGILQ